MHQDMQLCGLLLQAHCCTNSPNTHRAKQQVWPLEWGVISYAFTLYLHRSTQAPSVCLCEQPSLSLFFLCVCECVFDKGRGGEREMEREGSGSCIYTCMSRSLLAGRQRNTPAA